AFALAIALGLSFGPVQAAEGDVGPGAATPKMDTPSAAPDVGTPGATPNAREERPGQSSAQPQGAPGKSVEGSEGNLPAQGKSAQERKPSEGKSGTTAEGKAGTEGKSVKLQSQDVSKVKSYFSEHKPSVQRIEKSRVSVSIGVALPGTV